MNIEKLKSEKKEFESKLEELINRFQDEFDVSMNITVSDDIHHIGKNFPRKKVEIEVKL